MRTVMGATWEPRNSAFWSRHLSPHPFSLTYRCMCSSVSPRLAILLTLISCTWSLLFQRRRKLYSFVWLLLWRDYTCPLASCSTCFPKQTQTRSRLQSRLPQPLPFLTCVEPCLLGAPLTTTRLLLMP